MSVGVDESGKDNLAFAINLDDGLTVLLEPRITHRVFAFTDGNNLTSEAKHGSVFDDAQFVELRPAARTGFA
jgi:hypothetical protein